LACIASCQASGVSSDALGRKLGLQALAGLVQVGGITRDKRHLRALLQEGLRTGQADAFAAASDQNVLVLKLQIHEGAL
jgi:hypothetical protein